MEEVKETKKPEIIDTGIDKEVLDIMAEENILKSVSDEKQIRRVVLNCLCEMLSQFKAMNEQFNDFMNTLSICSADKVQEYFTVLRDNVKKEETRAKVRQKVAKSHQKAKKVQKSK